MDMGWVWRSMDGFLASFVFRMLLMDRTGMLGMLGLPQDGTSLTG